MKTIIALAAAIGLVVPAAAQDAAPAARAAAWTHMIDALADDAMQGRQTGSPGYLRAADIVVARFRALGLAPAGDGGGYTQAVAFEQQTIDQRASRASLVGADGVATPFPVGDALLVGAGTSRRPSRIDAPLVFIGYGLHLPRLGHDDLAGVDLKGRIAVVVSGGPDALPGPAKAANRNARLRDLAAAGAVGLVSLVTPAQVEIPWARQRPLADQPGMYLADRALRDAPDGFFTASVDPAQADRLFAGSGHGFAQIAALADAGAPLPHFALSPRLRASVSASYASVTSPNLVARLEGADPALRAEHVVLSAHLDHLGVGAPIGGDRIYNGAMDDASGVASVLDIAGRIVRGARPKRSILFVIVTAEEKGLLGSRYFARRPTVAAAGLVADLNFDMPLPLWPLRTILAQGDHESTLGDNARAVAAALGLSLVADPLPNRNSFVRTDQFSFVRAGIPALSFKFGFAKDTRAFAIEHDWRANVYHSPLDNPGQPGVLPAEAIRLDDYVAALALDIANAPSRPAWLATSVFNPAAGD